MPYGVSRSAPRRRSGDLVCFALFASLTFFAPAVCCAGAVAKSDSPGAVVLVDAAGRTLELEQPARRIISLSPHITELLYAIGAQDHLVGVVEYSDYPEAARTIPRIGSAARIDLEQVLALAPDALIGWRSGNRGEDVARLRKLGFLVYLSEPQALQDIAALTRDLGRLSGREQAAQAAADNYLKELRQLRRRYGGQAPLTVFHQIWERPLMTVNGDHIISRVIALCGGQNIFQQLDGLAPAISEEAVLLANPEVIFTSTTAAQADRILSHWRQRPSLKAVARNNLFNVSPDLLHRPTLRILDGAKILCERLQRARKNVPADQ